MTWERLPGYLLLLSYLLMLGDPAGKSQSPAKFLHAMRESPSDLEIVGMVRGLKGSAFVSYADLLELPQVRATITNNPEHPEQTLRVRGVSLEALATAIGADPAADLVEATCADRYRSHFPAGYIAKHHPMLILSVNGLTLAAWAHTAGMYDASPYTVMYADFKPAFRVLAHADAPQLPDNVLRLNFTTQTATFGAVAPPGEYAADSPVTHGFAIAKQNCLRCHFRGQAGGTKSGQSWLTLSTWAAEQPAYFKAYVQDPLKIERNAHMPGNPAYDARTLEALVAYFRTFSANAGTK